MPIQKVLVVDDSPTERQFLLETLRAQGYQCTTAGSGAEAIASVQGELPDLILMDVVMPDMDGLQTMRALHRDERTKGIPVIICSNKRSEADRSWGMRQGAKDYLIKPIKPSDLFAKIAALG